MNLPQRIVLILGFLAILGMALFPPWVYVYDYPGCCSGRIHAQRSERPGSYHLIFGQHIPQDSTGLVALFNIDTTGPKAPLIPAPDRLEFFSLRIDGGRLTVQLVGTLLLTAILYFALRSNRS